MAKLFNQHTNRQGLFVYGGESSADYGMVIGEAPTFEQPNRKQTVFNVPGRNGAIVLQQDAWEDVKRVYKVWIAEDTNKSLPEIVAGLTSWLNSQNGYVRLEDSFEPDVFRLAYYSGGNNISNELLQYGETNLEFTCRPERFYKNADSFVDIDLGGSEMFNPTPFKAKPLIRIEGTGTVNVVLSGMPTQFIVTFDNADTSVTIDCETMNAYNQNGVLINSQTSGPFPYAKPGKYTALASPGTGSTVTKFELAPRYFII